MTIHPDSPDYQFDPSSLGWLHRKLKLIENPKLANKELIKAEDLARIGRADAAAFGDPAYQEQVLLALDGKLPGQKGRRSTRQTRLSLLMAAYVLIEGRAEEIWAERRAKPVKYAQGHRRKEPRAQAADEVAAFLKMKNISGQTLRNEISSRKVARLLKE